LGDLGIGGRIEIVCEGVDLIVWLGSSQMAVSYGHRNEPLGLIKHGDLLTS